MISQFRVTTALLITFLLTIHILPAQKGAEQVYHDIRQLGVLANVLYVAAHPDDENTRMISYLSNHLHVNTTYLSLTRGDGGQNLIGNEFRDMLGLIRSHELLEARRIDGGNQLFTRANDFGYSKSPEETFTIWDRDQVLSDVVWAVRTTKPDIIITRFTSNRSRPNHGHHTASAIPVLYRTMANAAIVLEYQPVLLRLPRSI
jgi:LmbE family N-acetylglucosaminyl deacetylase